MMRHYNTRLMDRTCEIINRGGVILLKRADGWYLGQHTNISAGYGDAAWGCRLYSMHVDNLELAFALAKYFECKVVSYYPRGSK